VTPTLPPNLTISQGQAVQLLALCRAFDEASAVTIHEAARMSVHHGPLVPGVVSRLQHAGFAMKASRSRFGQNFTVYWLTPAGRRLSEDLAERDALYAAHNLPSPTPSHRRRSPR
jgi:hypothetical protein